MSDRRVRLRAPLTPSQAPRLGADRERLGWAYDNLVR
jgi:hypothetical protein